MKLAIYDFDGTLVNLQTLPALYKRWKTMKINERSRRPIWRKIMIRYVFHKLNLFGWNKRKFHPYTMEQTIDLFRSVDQDTLTQFLKVHCEHLLPHVTTTIRSQLEEDHNNGYHTVLLSGNYDMILEPFRVLGFDTIIGTPSRDAKGQLFSRQQVNIIIEDGKAEAIKRLFSEANLAESRAYADSWYDLPLLELVGHPIVVDPDNPLREYAHQKGWDILETNK